MAMKKIDPIDAANLLLGSSNFNPDERFLFNMMKRFEKTAELNLTTSQAKTVYVFFYQLILSKLRDGVDLRPILLYEGIPGSDEPDDGTDDKPQEDPGMTNPDDSPCKPIPPDEMDRPNPVDNMVAAINHIKNCYNPDPMGIENIKRIGCGPYKGYVSGSNVDMKRLEEGEEIIPKDKERDPKYILRSDATKKMLHIDMIMKCYDLKQDEAKAVYASLRKEEGRPPLSECAFEALNHIEKVSDLINNL